MREFRILGPLEAARDQQAIGLGGPRQRALLAILLIARREVLSADRLIDRLWSETPPPTAAKTLQVYISHLRTALGSDAIATRGNGYQLTLAADDWIDADRFEAWATEGRHALAAGDPAHASELLASALAIWRGGALSEFATEAFAVAEIARLDEARLVALEDRIDADLGLGRHRDLIGELEALVRAHPLRERIRGQLMLALYRCGRQADALEAYRVVRQALDDELGLEPGPDLRDLEQRILGQDPSLDAPRPPPPVATAALEQPPPPTPTRRTSRPRTALLAIGGTVLLAAAVAAAVTELTGGSAAGSVPAPNSIAAIAVSNNHVTGWVPVGAQPGPVTYGAGSLWVGNAADSTVSRVDPTRLVTLRALPLHAPPTSLAAADGHIWVATSNASQAAVGIDRIDPQYDVVTHTTRLRAAIAGAPGVVAAHDGSLWAAPSFGLLARLDAGSGKVLAIHDPNNSPSGLAVGDGSVWTTDKQADNVNQIEPSGLVTSHAVGNGPSGIAITADAVWVTDTGDNQVVRINPTTGAVTASIRVGSLPLGLTVGTGSVWVANSGSGTVSRIDPADNKVTATIRVGGSPQALTVADGHAWVTIDAGAPTSGNTDDQAGVLRIASPIDVDSMDPALAYQWLSWQLLYPTCAKLLNYPDRSGQAGSHLTPEVAQALPTVSDDGRTYTFTIRPGFRFSPPSNQAVTARTFRDTIERTLNPRMHSPVGGQLDDVVGVRAFRAGTAAHIRGITTRGSRLRIRLLQPEPDLTARLAEPFFCAVPPNTPVNPAGVPVIPSAGPYHVTSYLPNQEVTLTRNPNYHGDRPHLPARIVVTMGDSRQQAVSQVEAGTADFVGGLDVPPDDDSTLNAKYGPDSTAAKAGRQQYFVTPIAGLDFLSLNSHRPLFAQPRLRRAVNFAINRTALARLGADISPSPDTPADLYIPPGVYGYSPKHVYPMTPDLKAARRLARGQRRGTAVLYTCGDHACQQHTQIIKNDLAPLRIHVKVKQLPPPVLYQKVIAPHSHFDIADVSWSADYLDPDDFMNFLIERAIVGSPLRDATVRRQLARAARLTGPQRYLTYSHLDRTIARRAAPFVAYGNDSTHTLFSARIGCQTFGPYGVDLAALCIRNS